MKKDSVYKIYDLIKEQYVVNNFNSFLVLSNDSGEILYEFVKNCKDIMNEDNLKALINLAYSMYDIKDMELRRQTIKKINEMLSNDYVRNDSNIYKILCGINFLLNYDYNNSFEIEDMDDLYFYICFTVDNLIDIIQSTLNENMDMNILYTHNMSYLVDNYVNVVIDLDKSTSDDKNLSDNDIRLKRLTYYKDILSNKDIVLFNKKKYNNVVSICSSVTNIEKLKKMERIILFNKFKSNNEFIEIIDSYCEDFNCNTIANIYSKIGLKKTFDEKTNEPVYTRKIQDEKKEEEIVKKVLKPNKKS